jgi:hypothetical protein
MTDSTDFVCRMRAAVANAWQWLRPPGIVVLSGLILWGVPVRSQAAATNAPVQHMHQAGKIRLYYYTEGQHAVAALDTNTNGVPDQVEDVLTQTRAAWTLFVDVLGFPDPLKTERYRSASFLDIHFRHKDTLKANGVAYDELQRYNRRGDPKGTLSLCFNVATSVQAASNLTPAHEFFHVIQNSTTYFKNRWFTEGTARWSQSALGAGGLGTTRKLEAWPLTETNRVALFKMAYEASEHFWHPLCARDDAESVLPDSPTLKQLAALRYADGSPVLKDNQLTGWRLIRDVLAELDQADDVAFRQLGYARWSEENQRSPRNNPFILQAVADVVQRRGTRAP